MKTKLTFLRSFAGLLMLLCSGLASAQWNTNTSVNMLISGLPTADLQSVPTSDGKTWIAYYHENSGNYDMRAQLIDADGYKLLGADGVLVSNLASGSATFVFNVCVDASNNLVIGFQHEGTGIMSAVVHKISQTGAQLWGAGGIILGGGMVPYPALLSTGEIVVTWNSDNGNTLNIQKITNSGSLAWTAPVVVTVGTSTTTRGQLIGNLAGKFTMVYQKMGYGVSTTLYAQMFNPNGTAVYAPLQICNQTTSAARYYSIVADGDVTYFGYYSSNGFRFNSFLQRIDPGGTIPWGMNGSAFNTNVNTYDDYQMYTMINLSGASNYVWSVCNFSDYNQNQYGIYVQKFLKTTGARQFTDNAKVVYAIGPNSNRPEGNLALVNDNPMFMFADVNDKIYVTRLDANGNFAWAGNQVEISSTTASTGTPKMRYGFTPDGPNRCAGIWTENRTGSYMGYAQGISVGGLVGLVVATQGSVPPTITTSGGTLQMVATVFPLTANQNVTWSIVPVTGNAAISTAGLVTATGNGTVYAKAVAVQDVTVKDSLLITISGQIIVNPVVVTNAASNILLTSATLNGSVTANLYPTTVTFDWGLNTSYGNSLAATPPTVTGYAPVAVSANLSGLTSNVTYHCRCVGVSTAGTFYGADQTFTPGCPTIAAAGAITGPASVCVNATGKTYSIAPITNATGYTWSVPAGATITSGQNTTSIVVNFGSTSGNVSVYGTNFCSSGTPSNLPVTVSPPPVPSITGSATACQGGANATYTTESGMTAYTWSVSSGGSIVIGLGTNQIQVSWNASGPQWVSVNYTSTAGCAATTPSTFSVTVDPLPSTAGSITGTAAVCGGATGVSYSVAPVINAVSYIWTLPLGASVTAGYNTNAITVSFTANASSGPITVQGNNLCGSGPASPPFQVTVTPLPSDPGTIEGPDQVCENASGIVYSIAPITAVTDYHWTVPSGAFIVNGANTNAITVDFGPAAVSGNITVYGSNSCGDGSVSTLPVSLNPVPPAPVITLAGPVLSSNATDGNQWFFNGSLIPGATGQNYTVTAIGWYWDVVNINGCSSDTSNNIYITLPGMDEPTDQRIRIYPVPTSGIFTVSLSGRPDADCEIEVCDVRGISVFKKSYKPSTPETDLLIDITGASPGCYFVRIRTGQDWFVKPLLVNGQ